MLRPRTTLVAAALAALQLGAPPAAATPPVAGVLAHGRHGTLTADAALAFHAALLFSLGSVGRPDVAAGLSEPAVLRALARAYPDLPPAAQRSLANARAVWTETQRSWPERPPASRRAFVREVLVFAFGEDAADGDAVSIALAAAPARTLLAERALSP